MAENVLEKIINIKSEKILELKKSISLEALEELIKKNSTYVDFKDTIKKNIENKKFSIIAEIKKASPSAGIIINCLLYTSPSPRDPSISRMPSSA